jgi:hypothetical protein
VTELDKLPWSLAGRWAGWKACRISDPVERLRFLRRTVGDRRAWSPATPAGREWVRRRRIPLAVMAFTLLAVLLPAGRMVGLGRLWQRSPVLSAQAGERAFASVPDVWLLETHPGYETWSNGLRVERRYEVRNEPRSYLVIPLGASDLASTKRRDWPAGIVYHSTESQVAPLAPDQAGRLLTLGGTLLDYVRTEKAYNYVVDRFGRVWRIVVDSDAANHAGYSVWADGESSFVNLNGSFLAVSVQAQTTAAGGEGITATPAQVHALRILTEMLRSRYRIAARNCVTHAQVSVNPSNMHAGYHTDWSARFPYVEIGLPDNYALPAPSLWNFGFQYDGTLVEVSAGPYWRGLLLGEEQLRQNATAHGMEVAAYRRLLAERYKKLLNAVKAEDTGSKDKAKEKVG